MSDIPFLAIGADELGDEVNDTASCPHCGQILPVQYGEEVMPDRTRKASKLLGYVSCGGQSYIVAIGGRKFK